MTDLYEQYWVHLTWSSTELAHQDSWVRPQTRLQSLCQASVALFTTSSLDHSNVWPRLRAAQETLGRRQRGPHWMFSFLRLSPTSSWGSATHPSGTSSDATSLGHLFWLIPREECTTLPFAQQSSPHPLTSLAESTLGQDSGRLTFVLLSPHIQVLSERVKRGRGN